MVQWLGLRTFTAEGESSIPGWGTNILQAARHSQKKKKKVCTDLSPPVYKNACFPVSLPILCIIRVLTFCKLVGEKLQVYYK